MTNRTPSTIDPRWWRLVIMAAIALPVFGISGRLSPHFVNDSPSYLNYPLDSLREAMLSIRTPGYPLFLALLRSTTGIALVPFLQLLLHLAAAWMLCEELVHRKMPTKSALVAGLCVLLGCTAMDHLGTVSTDAPAASLGVLSVVLLLRSQRSGKRRDAVWCALIAAAAIFVRPAYLFLIPWLAVASALLALRDHQIESDPSPEQEPTSFRSGPMTGSRIAIAVTLLVLCWVGARKWVVDDFAIAPFGHQNLSAILVQTVPSATLRSLPPESRDLGNQIADRLEEREFQQIAGTSEMLPTLTIEDQWGQINYSVVWPIARQMDPVDAKPKWAEPIRTHRRIGALNRAILAAAPANYIRWLMLAARRAAWGTVANVVMHPLFLGLAVIGMFVLVFRACTRQLLGPVFIPEGWGALAIVAISYAVLGIGFVILTSPPLGRFADASAILLPSLVFCLPFAQPRDLP